MTLSYDDIDRRIRNQEKADLFWLNKVRARILSRYAELSNASSEYSAEKHDLCLQLAKVEREIERKEAII